MKEVKLPDVVKGYIIFRQCNLTQTQEDQVTTWTQGKYDRDVVVKALRRLEKVQKEKAGSKGYLAEADDENVAEETFGNFPDEEDADIEQYVYLADGDLDQIFDEDDVHAALATYQQVRRAIRDQKTARGFKGYKSAGKGATMRVNTGAKVQFGQQGTKVHIESLKLRTRCARCGMIGHWAKECGNPPDDFAKRRNDSSSAASSSAKMSNMSGKSGFVHVGGEGSTLVCTNQTSCSTVPMGSILSPSSLSSRVSSCSCKIESKGNVLERRMESFGESISFCGITTHGAFGLVDTAAQSGLIGVGALNRLSEILKDHGLKVRWTPKKGQARGVGGEARCKGVIEIPMGVGGVCGVLEATVVEEDVPLLLPVRLLKELRAVIDFSSDQLFLKKFGAGSMLSTLPSGHVAVSIVDFGRYGWQLPVEAKAKGLVDSEFRLNATEAMNNSVLVCHHAPSLCPFVAIASNELDRAVDSDGQSQGPGDESGRAGRGGEKPESFAIMEKGGIKTSRSHPAVQHQRAVRAGNLARRWICLWMVAASQLTGADGATFAELSRAIKQTRRESSADQVWSAASTTEGTDRTQGACSGVCSSSQEPGWWRKSTPKGSVVHGVSLALEGRDDGESSTIRVQGISQDSSTEHCGRLEDFIGESGTVNSIQLSGNGSYSADGSEQHSMQMQHACGEAHSEEGRSDEGSALLQMPFQSLRLLPMGPHGDSPNAGSHGVQELEARAGGEPRDLQVEGRVRAREEEDGGRAPGYAPDAAGEGSGQSGKDGDDDGTCQSATSGAAGRDNEAQRDAVEGVQCQASRALGGEQHGLSKPCRTASTSSVLAHHAGEPRQDPGGDERSPEVCRNLSASQSVAAGDGSIHLQPAMRTQEAERSLSSEGMSQLIGDAPWVYQVTGEKAMNLARNDSAGGQGQARRGAKNSDAFLDEG